MGYKAVEKIATDRECSHESIMKRWRWHFGGSLIDMVVVVVGSTKADIILCALHFYKILPLPLSCPLLTPSISFSASQLPQPARTTFTSPSFVTNPLTSPPLNPSLRQTTSTPPRDAAKCSLGNGQVPPPGAPDRGDQVVAGLVGSCCFRPFVVWVGWCLSQGGRPEN